jgi:hypothetical protein
MTETEKYVLRYLNEELSEVISSPIINVSNGLDRYEKTLIYHYTSSGYLGINRAFRKKYPSKSGKLLREVLTELPDYQGQVYRLADLTTKQIAKYRTSFAKNAPIVGPTFVSASQSPLTARLYPKWNVRFQILSRHGKNIDEMSYLGLHKPPNEKEILFPPGCSFTILEVTDSNGLVLILMEEN